MSAKISLSLAAPALVALAVPAFAAGFDETKFYADDAASQDQFSRDSVALSGGIAIVGSQNDDDGGNESGSVYLFNAETGAQLRKITASAPDANDYFGSAVGISGNVAIVGARGDDDAGNDSGAAYLYDVTDGSEIAKLTKPAGAVGAAYGTAVAIDGGIAAVAARSHSVTANSDGAVYLYDVADQSLIASLSTPGGATVFAAGFGQSIALSDGLLAVGTTNMTSVYVFDATTGAAVSTLSSTDTTSYDQFGRYVDISDGVVIVGAVSGRANSSSYGEGVAYLFDAATGEELSKLVLPTGVTYTQAIEVAISGGYALLNTGKNGGEVFVYEVASGEQVATLTPSDTSYNGFGAALSFDGARALVSAYVDTAGGAGYAAGAAYTYDLSEVVSASDVSAVPLPAGVWLLSGALGMLGLRARARRA